MRRNLIILVYGLLCITATRSHGRCESYQLTDSFRGRYCPTAGIIIPNLSWDQCKLFCLHTPSCQAVNYDFTASLCAYFTSTCPNAISNPDMAFVLFTARQPHQCLDWIPKQTGHLPGNRLLTEDNVRFAARIQKDGNDFVCYLLTTSDDCMSLDVNERRIKSSDGYPCQILQIRDGCTVYYVDYDLGDPLPRNALIGGYTATGLPVYIGRGNPGGGGIGYYIPGSHGLVVNYFIRTFNVQLLVRL